MIASGLRVSVSAAGCVAAGCHCSCFPHAVVEGVRAIGIAHNFYGPAAAGFEGCWLPISCCRRVQLGSCSSHQELSVVLGSVLQPKVAVLVSLRLLLWQQVAMGLEAAVGNAAGHGHGVCCWLIMRGWDLWKGHVCLLWVVCLDTVTLLSVCDRCNAAPKQSSTFQSTACCVCCVEACIC